MFQKPSLLPSSGKKVPNLFRPHRLSCSQSLGPIATVNMLRHSPESRSSPKVVTRKWLLTNQKLTTRLKNKTSNNPQINPFTLEFKWQVCLCVRHSFRQTIKFLSWSEKTLILYEPNKTTKTIEQQPSCEACSCLVIKKF